MIRCGFHSVNLRLVTRDKHFIRAPRVPSKCLLLPAIWRRWGSLGGRPVKRPTASRYRIFNRLPRPPPGDVASWSALLDLALPAHLRRGNTSDIRSQLDADDVAEILLAAQRQTIPSNGIDLLYHLGFEEGRWSAVVWLVKLLVDAFAHRIPHHSLLFETVVTDGVQSSLGEMTRTPIARLARKTHLGTGAPTRLDTLHDLTNIMQPGRFNFDVSEPKDALGQIWRSLGRMTIACADGEIKPEILELIAFLHHKELMPMSIYNSKPSPDATQIQQPPMLNLFSSRILTSLSDAAWRAHSKLIVEEAKSEGRDLAYMRPEIPGAAYRVRIAGLRPEVWLELILWASLHGGWIVEGTSILHDIQREPEPRRWKTYSWRSLLSDQQQAEADWTELEHAFNTNPSSSLSAGVETDNGISIRRTISSEVVNAYVDALPSIVRVGVGERGISSAQILSYLTMLRGLLRRSGLTLSAGSWDSIVLRFLDSQENVVDRIGQVEELVGLAPFIGEELNPRVRRDLPSYIFDGSNLTIGMLHQSLRSRITAGDMEGSIHLLRLLLTRADRNKHQSLMDFFGRLRRNLVPDDTRERADTLTRDGLFTSNFAGIEYPAFDVQLPPTILGPLLELVMDAEAYDIGKWLLNDEDIDGPIIPPTLYRHKALTPALIRFATEAKDQAVMAKIINPAPGKSQTEPPGLTLEMLQNFLDSEIKLKNWNTVSRLLNYVRDHDGMSWNIHNLAVLARSMLQEVPASEAQDSESQQHLARSSEIFRDMVLGRFERPGDRGVLQHKITLLMTILASADASWAGFCLGMQPLQGFYSFSLISNKVFGVILQGVVSAYGSTRGRNVLDNFWPSNIQRIQKESKQYARDGSGESIMPRSRPKASEDPQNQRIVIKFPGHPDEQVTVYRGLWPNMITIRIILEKALREFRRQQHKHFISNPSDSTFPNNDGEGTVTLSSVSLSTTTSGNVGNEGEAADIPPAQTIAWSVHCLRSMHMAEADIRRLVQKRLSPASMQTLQVEHPDLFMEHTDEVEWKENSEEEQGQEQEKDLAEEILPFEWLDR